MAKTDGKAAVMGVIAAAAAEAAEEQLELMPPTRPSLTARQVEQVETAIRHDRRGRPPGARNVKTREMVAFLTRTIGDPLERRWRYMAHTPETLAIELGCTKLEALQFLDRLWADLTRYVHAQLAQVDGKGNAVAPVLNMIIGGQPAHITLDGKAKPPWEYLEQNQPLLEAPDHVSHGDVSHDDG